MYHIGRSRCRYSALLDNDHFHISYASCYTRCHVLRVVMEVKVKSMPVKVEVGDLYLLQKGW